LTVTNAGQMTVTGNLNIDPYGSVSAASEVLGGGTAFNSNIVVGPGTDDGNINQTGGTNTDSGTLYLALETVATGEYLLSGGSLTVTGPVYVGGSASSGSGGTAIFAVNNTGQMTVNNSITIFTAASVSAADEYIGGGTAANAAIVVGPGTLSGTINQTGGTNSVSGEVELASSAGTTGTYILSGGLLSVSGNERLGYDGMGIFNQSAGTNSANTNFDLGFNAGATGSYTLSGGALDVAGTVNVGGQNSGAGGVGTLTVSNNGEMTVTGAFRIYNNGVVSAVDESVGSGPPNTGTILIGPGNDNGIVNQTGGTNTISNELEIAVLGESTGKYTLSNTGSLSVTQDEFVGDFGDGLFNQSGGTNTAENVGGFTIAFSVGYGVGSTGTYTLSGGALSVDGGEYVGYDGTGTFNQSGGTNSLTGDISIAAEAGVNGTYLLSGGALKVGGNVNVGGQDSAAGGTGTLTISNTGQMTVTGTLRVYGHGDANIGGTVAMVGGLTISTGGLLNINSALLIGTASGTTESAIQQYIEGGSITSTYATTNSLDIGYAEASDANMAGSKLATDNPGDLLIEPALAGDTDLNGTVNIHDLQNLLTDFNAPGFWDEGNFNGHADVDISDLQALLTNFNTSVTLSYSELAGIENLVGEFGDMAIRNTNGTGFTLVAVPEPASAGLLAIGAGLLVRRRRSRTPNC
jgi:hypothetical protein